MTEIASFDVGRYVECDACGEVLTDDPRSGGFLFGGSGYGPCCAVSGLRRIKRYGEEHYIRAFCPEGVSFADWIRDTRLQTPDGNKIRIYNGLDILFGPDGAS